MAVTQISKIQIRRGLQENLPQLSSAEMGWSIDEQRLFIGNGTLAEGAPVTGMTEILTAQSMYSELALIESLEGNVSILFGNVAAVEANVATISATLELNSITLLDAVPVQTNIAVSLSSLSSRTLDYTIVRGTTSRVGSIQVTQLSGTPVFQDDYVETADTGVVLNFVSNASNVTMTYTTTSTGEEAEFKYYIRQFV
jgi:hypothetical protein